MEVDAVRLYGNNNVWIEASGKLRAKAEAFAKRNMTSRYDMALDYMPAGQYT